MAMYDSGKLPERGTGSCRTVPYDKHKHVANIEAQYRNKRNRVARADEWGSGKEADRRGKK